MASVEPLAGALPASPPAVASGMSPNTPPVAAVAETAAASASVPVSAAPAPVQQTAPAADAPARAVSAPEASAPAVNAVPERTAERHAGAAAVAAPLTAQPSAAAPVKTPAKTPAASAAGTPPWEESGADTNTTADTDTGTDDSMHMSAATVAVSDTEKAENPARSNAGAASAGTAAGMSEELQTVRGSSATDEATGATDDTTADTADTGDMTHIRAPAGSAQAYWNHIVQQLQQRDVLQAFAGQLAVQAECIAFDAQQLHLRVAQDKLSSDSAQDKLRTVLAEHAAALDAPWGGKLEADKLQWRVERGTVNRSYRLEQEAVQAARQQAAEAAFMAAPTVQALMRDWDARPVSGSIQPVHAENTEHTAAG